jgi:hypothetical protein
MLVEACGQVEGRDEGIVERCVSLLTTLGDGIEKADEYWSVVMGKGGAIKKEAGRTRRLGCCADGWSTTDASRDT